MEDVVSFEDAMKLLKHNYFKILKVNLDQDSHVCIECKDETVEYSRFSSWISDFAEKGGVHPDDARAFEEFNSISSIKEHFKKDCSPLSLRYRRKSGDSYRWAMVEILPVKDFGPEDPHVILYASDIHDYYSHELEYKNHLEHVINHDSLTDLYNFLAYKTLCTKNSSRMLTNTGVLFSDINGLKLCNDTKGHDAGTRMIMDYAGILTDFFPKEFCYRTGGDEFIVIMPDADKSDFLFRARQMVRYLSEMEIPIASVGYWFSDTPEPLNQTVNRAEDMMYTEKTKFYMNHPDFKRSVVNELEILSGLCSEFTCIAIINMPDYKTFFYRNNGLPEEITLLLSGGNFQKDRIIFGKKYVREDQYEQFMNDCDMETVTKRLEGQHTYRMRFQSKPMLHMGIEETTSEWIFLKGSNGNSIIFATRQIK